MSKQKWSTEGIEKWSPVIIEWVDATYSAEADAKVPDTYISAYVPHIRHLIGFFLGDVADHVHVAMSDDRLPDQEAECDVIWTVHHGSILSITGQVKKDSKP